MIGELLSDRSAPWLRITIGSALLIIFIAAAGIALLRSPEFLTLIGIGVGALVIGIPALRMFVHGIRDINEDRQKRRIDEENKNVKNGL